MRGCVLHGKVVFASDDQNSPRKPVKAPEQKPEKHPTPPRRRLPF
jgi:hypothetical protein